MSNPFDVAIKAAEAREAAEAAEHKRQSLERAARQEQARQERIAHECIDFGKRFLEVVVQKVVLPNWKPAYIRQVQSFAEGLLLRHELENVPAIEATHRDKILDIFAYGLKLKAEHGAPIPEGTFYGQRLLVKQEAPEAEGVVTLDNVIPLSASSKRKSGRQIA